MPPKSPAHVTRTQTGEIRRRVTAAAGAPPAEVAPIVGPSVGTTDVMADAIAAAVLRQLEQSGRLLPLPVAQAAPSVPTPAVAQAAPEVSSDDDDDVDAALSGLLVGELYTPLPSYHVISRPLGASLPDSLKTKIRRGDYVNLQLLLVDNDDDDDDNMYEQQQQRLTLQVGRQDTLYLLKPSTNKASKTIDQWVTAFTIYGAVLTEPSPHLAPGIFKHIAGITEMAPRFGGLAWYHYDKAYRKEMGANHLSYGQVYWDLRFRCLERTSNRPGVIPFGALTPVTHTSAAVLVSPSVKGSRKASASCPSSLAHVPNLPANSHMPVLNAQGNIPLADVPSDQPALKQLRAQAQCALPTSINSQVLSHYLADYNPADTPILIQGFSVGFSLHYDGPQVMRFSDNHQSALQASTLVNEKIYHEIHLGRIAGPFDEPPFFNFHSSPLGLVPKHDPGKFRLIHDLSFPKDDSINSYTSREFTTVQYETLDRVVELVRSCGRNCLIAKADIQEAFRLIPIRSQDYPLLGFTWQGKYYHDKVLPMGSAVSCQTFERFSRAQQ